MGLIDILGKYKSTKAGGKCFLAVKFSTSDNHIYGTNYLVTYFPNWDPDSLFHGILNGIKNKKELGTLPRFTPIVDRLSVLCQFNPSLSEEEVTVDYIKTFHRPIPEVEINSETHLNGWISPGGSYYVCSPTGHENLATDIIACNENKLGTSADIEKTWVKVATRYGFLLPDLPTKNQIKTLMDLISAVNNRSWADTANALLLDAMDDEHDY